MIKKELYAAPEMEVLELCPGDSLLVQTSSAGLDNFGLEDETGGLA